MTHIHAVLVRVTADKMAAVRVGEGPCPAAVVRCLDIWHQMTERHPSGLVLCGFKATCICDDFNKNLFLKKMYKFLNTNADDVISKHCIENI